MQISAAVTQAWKEILKIWQTLGRFHEADFLHRSSHIDRLHRINKVYKSRQKAARKTIENLVHVPFETGDAHGLTDKKPKTLPHVSTGALVNMFVVDRDIGRKRIVVPSFDDVFEKDSEWLLLNASHVPSEHGDHAVLSENDSTDFECNDKEMLQKGETPLHLATVGPTIVNKEATTQTN